MAYGSSHEPRPDLRDLSILVVDDDTDTRELFELVLARAGARVTTAGTAIEARDAAARTHFDVLVSDVAMPHHTGIELMQWLRAAHGPAMYAIGVSGHSRQKDRELALAAGFDAYVTKPFTPDALVAYLGEALARRSRPDGDGSRAE